MNNLHPKHPLQPLLMDDGGRIRFKANKIVDFMAHKIGLNELAAMDFPQEDWEQLAQLIGYSLSGFGDLSYVRDETFFAAENMHKKGVDERDARIAHLEGVLAQVRSSLREIVPSIFRIHQDDLIV